MVSWFVKEALVRLSKDLGRNDPQPTTREGWGRLMQSLGVKGVHIAEIDTQVPKVPRPYGIFCNTWSSEGFIAEGLQPSELGWGTHEKWFPPHGHRHEKGCKAGIYMERPGCDTRVKTWVPSYGAQFGLCVTHNESISIADYFTVGCADQPEFRPTVHYAYNPCEDSHASFREMVGAGKQDADCHVYALEEIETGVDELGVLLYGHAKNAFWFGSTLSHEETVALDLNQNATGMQVTSAVLALVWALENPKAGVVETDEIDHNRCLEVQSPYLGKVWGAYTDWTPLQGVGGADSLFTPPARTDKSDPWQFANVLVDSTY